MTPKSDILLALQFAHIVDKDPMNTTGDPRTTITWQYAGTSEPGDFPYKDVFSGWDIFAKAEEAAIETALAQIETFLNVDFVRVTGSIDPDLNIASVDIPGATAGYGGNAISFIGTEIVSYDSFVAFDNTLDLSSGGQFNLLLHELGHALGLKHPFSDPILPASEDNNKYTVMSYSANPDNAQLSDAMMLFDVYALQDIWGGATFQEGDSIYSGPRTKTVDTIWDTGGIDTFDASTKVNGVRLDLREGAFSVFDTYEDVVIAYGTQIENATGGAGADYITGNALRNVLKGMDGNDLITAGAKGDVLRGGKGNDILKGQGGRDKLFGEGGRDTLKGGRGNDVLNGQNGNDKLIGNQGADRFVFSKNGDKDIIRDFENDVDMIKITGLGTVEQILDKATEISGNVVFDFGNGDMLTVLNTTIIEVSDDLLT